MTRAHAQLAQPSDTEELRRRAQAEAQEREQQRQAPNVNLPTGAANADLNVDLTSHTLPSESPCFGVTRLTLVVPKELPEAVQQMGKMDTQQPPFLFARDYLSGYAGACIGKQGLETIVQRLGNLILSKGFSTTRVGILNQDLSGGELVIVLVPGVIRAIRFADPSMAGKWKNAFPTGPGQLLNLRDLEQGLEQMKRVSSQDVTMDIVPGDSPGQSDVVINVKRTSSWRLTGTLDDSGANTTGKMQAGVNLALDNLFWINDVLNVGLNHDADRNPHLYGTRGNSATYAIPAGYWSVALSGSSYDYHELIAGVNHNYVSSGITSNAAFKLSHLFQRDQSQKNSWQFTIGKRWNHAFIDDTEIAVQERDTTFAELAWINTTYIGRAQFDMTLSNRWGVNWLNGQTYSKNIDQQQDPTTNNLHYTLQTIDATLSAPLTIADQTLTYLSTFRGQTSRSPLYLPDQFSIGNRYSVRGFDGQLTLIAEQGFYWRNELDLPIAHSNQVIYSGIDVGKVIGANTVNLIGDKLAGVVLGAKGAAYGFTYDVFAGWKLYKPDGFKTTAPAAGFSLSYQY